MKVTFPDGTVAEVVDVEVGDEKTPWSTFKLDDGTVVKLRINVVGVQRALEKWDLATGNPVYSVQTNLAMRLQVPAKLKAKEIHKKKDTQEAKEVG